MTMNTNAQRTFRIIMKQVGTDGRTLRRDIAPYSTYANVAIALRSAVEMGLLIDGGDWIEATDEGYNWLSTNVDPEFGTTKQMIDNDNIESILIYLKESYPNFTLSSFHNSITARINAEKDSDFIELYLTSMPLNTIVSVYEEAWLRSQKWICYNRSYSEMYGHGSRFGGEDPTEVFKEAVESLHYRLNRNIEKAKLSEVFLQKTAKQGVD